MFQYEFMRNAFLAGILVSILCPIIGSFLVLKRFSMMGDTLSHSAFAGVASSLYLGIDPSLYSLIYTVINAFIIEALRHKFKNYEEIIMNVILTFNVGLAIVLASSKKLKTGISQFLFGSILTVTKNDIFLIAIVTVITILFIFLFYKKMVYSTFDEEGAIIHNINVKGLNYAFAILTGATIGVSIRITGLLVISSVLVLPVAASLNFKQGFLRTLLLSITHGLITVLVGLLLSYRLDTAPGGTIALVSVAILLISMIQNIFRQRT